MARPRRKASAVASAKSSGGDAPAPPPTKEFPAGMRVLVVDDDNICLEIMRKMLTSCSYEVTACVQAQEALSIMRENNAVFDILLTDVHMAELSGFELLKIGLEMDLPVVMISGDVNSRLVMDGIKYGACDFLVKPVRIEEFRNIWQHVIRKRQHASKHPGSLEESEHSRHPTDETSHGASANDGLDIPYKCHRKKKLSNENDDDEVDTGDSSSKKRVHWSPQLHQQFVSAVNQLGIDKAVPKNILKLMKVHGLSRENIASHLQKYRLYLKKGALQQGRFPNTLFGAAPHAIPGFLNRLDFSVYGIVRQQNALHSGLLCQPSGNLAATGMNQLFLKQASVQGPNHIPVKSGIAFGQPLVNLPTNMSEDPPLSRLSVERRRSCVSTLPINNFGAVSSVSNLGGVNNSQNSSVPMQMVQQGPPHSLSESSHAISEQPCMVVPSQASNNFMNENSILFSSQSLDNFLAASNPAPLNWNSMAFASQSLSSIHAGNTPVPCEQNHCSNNGGHISDYGRLFSQSNDEAFTNIEVFNSYPFSGSTYPSVSSCTNSITNWTVQTSDLGAGPANSLSCVAPNLCNIQDSAAVDTFPKQGLGSDLGNIGEGTCTSTQYAVDGIGSLANMSEGNNLMGDNEYTGAGLAFGFYGQL